MVSSSNIFSLTNDKVSHILLIYGFVSEIITGKKLKAEGIKYQDSPI